MHMSGTRTEKEVDIYATNLTNKTKYMITNAQKKMEIFFVDMQCLLPAPSVE
jgi:hypothetical protein